jgi:PAS domain S-box-containing protein
MWQNSVGARLFRALLPVALALSMSAAILSAQAPARRFHVLVVDSYHQGFAWGEAQFAGIRDALTEGLGANAAELSVFHLDDRRFPQKRELTAAYFMALYGDHPLDLVVTTDNAAWDFMKESDWRLKRRIPLVFAGVNDFHDDGRAGSLLMTGIAENFLTGRAETIKAAIALLPEIKRILLILDTTATSLAIRNEFMTIRGQFPGVIFDFVTEEDIDAQVKLVAALRQGDILVPIGTHRDSSGTLISYEEAMERLSAACPVPSFGFIENRIGHGIVGGRILTGQDHGRSAGELALAVLRGAVPASLQPVMDNPGRFFFDHRQLSRFHLSEAKLPPGSVLINKPSSPFEAIKGFLIAFSIIAGALGAIVVILVVSRRRLEAARDRLALSEAELESYYESSPDAIFIADDKVRFRRVNRSACDLTGYDRASLLSMSITDLVLPEDIAASITSFDLVKDSGRAIGQVRGLRPDGTIYWMSYHTARIGPDTNLAIIRDITQRLADEDQIRRSLREKESLLRELYHRTKNNMYIIISLLGLREPELKEEADRLFFREMTSRIRTMALVHEKLYRSSDLAHIRFDEYTRDIVDLLTKAYPMQHIDFVLGLEPLALSVDQALPLGLVLHELILNTLRHAFPEGSGTVRIGLGADDGARDVRITVQDNGCGFPQGFDPAKAETMGFQIITSIVEHQLGGALEWGQDQGTRCSLTFPIREATAMDAS